MFDNCKATVDKGVIGMAKAILEYQLAGYTVSVPLVDANEYDLVVEKDGVFQSVQCKATSSFARDGKTFRVGLRSIRTNTKRTTVKNRGKYDLLFVLCSNGTCYSIPSNALPQVQLELRPKYQQYKMSDHV